MRFHVFAAKRNEHRSQCDSFVFETNLRQMQPSSGVSLGMHRKPKISKLSAYNLIWDVFPAPFHYRTRIDSRVIWICNFMTTPGKLTYVHERVMRFVPGEPLWAYSAGKLQRCGSGSVLVCICCVYYVASSMPYRKFRNSFLGECRSEYIRSFAIEYEPDVYIDSGANIGVQIFQGEERNVTAPTFTANYPRDDRKKLTKNPRKLWATCVWKMSLKLRACFPPHYYSPDDKDWLFGHEFPVSRARWLYLR